MAIAPIHNLPPETLSQIFLCCLPPDDFVAISNRHAPLVLTLVCQYWRRIAIASPQLWSSLRVHDKLHSEAFPLIDTWLRRSADRPLSLALMLYDGDERRRSIVQGLLNRLVAHASRWHEVHLQLPRKTYAILFKRLKRFRRKSKGSPPQLPYLETLTIQTSNDTGNGVGEMLCSVLQAAPRLRSLFWADFGCTSCIIDTLPQSAGLMELLLDMNLTVNQALQILTHCPQLRECTFGALRHCDNAPPPISDPITLPELSSLTLHTCQDLGLFFDYITLPALRSLNIEYGGDNMEGHMFYPPWPVVEFAAMLWRSRSPVETLKLDAIGMSEWALIQSLQPVEHSLRRLHVRNFDSASVRDTLLGMWTCPLADENNSVSQYFCSMLETLELYDCLDVTCGKLAAMVQSRARVDRPEDVVPLRKLVISSGHMGDYRLLRKLEKEGALVSSLHMDLRSF